MLLQSRSSRDALNSVSHREMEKTSLDATGAICAEEIH